MTNREALMRSSKKTKKAPKKSSRSRRFSDEQRKLALTLVAGGMTLARVAKRIGTTETSVCNWRRAAEKSGTMPSVPPKPHDSTAGSAGVPRNEATVKLSAKSPYAPADPAHGLSDQEAAAILECKTRHLSMGPAQIRSQLKRFKGWRVSIKAIKRVLKEHGYESVYRGSRPQGEVIQRFEAPRRNALWQADFAEVRVGPERLYVLIMLDDFSRYVVGYALCPSPASAIVVETFRAAIARHGKPESVRTDRGGAFVAFAREGDFGRVLEAEDVTHIVGKSYRPKGGGKVESAVRTLRRELWDLEHFEDRDHAEQRLKEFFADYNERRAHMGIDGLTPADRFFGRADRVLAHINALSRHRQGVLAQGAPSGGAIEELTAMPEGSPMEVLRLVMTNGILELRFCGARVVLGQVEC
jgi:putative transposase